MKDLPSMLERAPQAATSGRPDAAEKCYLELLEQSPDHAEALGFVGMRMLRRGAAAQALTPLRRAQALSPDDLQINENLGIALMRCNDIDGAGQHLHPALQADPRLHRARLMLGKLMEISGQTRTAAAEYHRAIANAQRLGIRLSHEFVRPRRPSRPDDGTRR